LGVDPDVSTLVLDSTVAQKPGLGFPLARIAAVFSLACGAVVGMDIVALAVAVGEQPAQINSSPPGRYA
jgi:hypothetical protein